MADEDVGSENAVVDATTRPQSKEEELDATTVKLSDTNLSSLESEDEPPLREELISTAVHFLLNERVKNSPLSQKRTFLLRKGLSSLEIDAAIERATSGQLYSTSGNQLAQRNFVNAFNNSSPPSNGQFYGRPPQAMPLAYGPISVWALTRSLAPSMAIVVGVAYGFYLFYKRCLEPLLFARTKHPLVIIQESINNLTRSMDALRESLTFIESNIKSQIEADLAKQAAGPRQPSPVEIAAIADIKAEVLSLKALLLNRKQFPAAPKLDIGSGGSNASIPNWQLDDETGTSLQSKAIAANGISGGSGGESSD